MTVTVARLERWLRDDPERVERHLRRHPEAADLLDQATALGADLRAALSEAVALPADLLERLTARVDGLGDTGAPTTVLDLLGGGIAAMRMLVGLGD
jgi:hypothetical protein